MCIARAVIIDAVSQPQAMKKMLEKDFGKVFGFVANASMLVRALKSMGGFQGNNFEIVVKSVLLSVLVHTSNIQTKAEKNQPFWQNSGIK